MKFWFSIFICKLKTFQPSTSKAAGTSLLRCKRSGAWTALAVPPHHLSTYPIPSRSANLIFKAWQGGEASSLLAPLSRIQSNKLCP
ncbi:hypothetical protein TorRG33x02_170020 [Trema orientale]|uniref:Uncharacterized protein n=1 Tax=Trema orientale TaxID=63057 RepID=A0A2P5EP17_TREOI|nr:hypothetical protein TorRG33x02_170020 [Trema orientale]